ncbi:exported hypothetical protein [Syntrophobacter sp. SbD1]|nr:exported hypothetical protein [Syntrophobacter sp. SbD1]
MNCLRILTLWPIRAKLLLLILIAVMSAFGAVIRSYILERRHEIETAEHSSLLLVRSLAAQQKEIEISTKEVLGELAQSPEVQTLDVRECNDLLRKLNFRYPYYSILGALTPDGNLFASSVQFGPGIVNISDQKHLNDAIRSQDFSAGEYSVGRVTGVQTIHYAYPALDSRKHLIAVVTAGFKLDMYAGYVAKANLPLDSVVVITDSRGIRLYRSPKSEAAVLGQSIPSQEFEHMSGNLDEGSFEGIASDGNYRINAFKRLCLKEGSSPYLYMTVGIVKNKLLKNANFIFSSSLLFLGLAGFAILAIVWIFPVSPRKPAS